MTKRYELVIFDWDGTLMDSVARIVSSMQGAARDCGLPAPSADAVGHIVGLSLREAVAQLFASSSEAQVEAIIARYREHYLFLDETPTPLFEGVEECISGLHRAGYRLAVATGKARAGLDRVLKATGLEPYFHASRGADEARSKPDPLMLHQLLAEMSLAPQQAVMVGDSIYDMAMAEAIGMDRIGVNWGVHKPVQLAAHGPVAILGHMSELAEIV